MLFLCRAQMEKEYNGVPAASVRPPQSQSPSSRRALIRRRAPRLRRERLLCTGHRQDDRGQNRGEDSCEA